MTTAARLIAGAIALAVVTVCDGAALAQTVKLDRIDIVEYGLYTARATKSVASPNTASGTVRPVVDLKLVNRTTTVPARLGSRFGVRFVLAGSPKGREVKITYVTRFPPQGMRNPAKDKVFDKNEFEWPVTIGEMSYRTFTFDNSWEMVPGDWTLEFWDHGRKLGEKKFTVVAP